MTDVVVEVGFWPGGLASALAGLAAVAASDPGADRIVLDLREPILEHPPGRITLPPGVDRLLVRGTRGPRSGPDPSPPGGFAHTFLALPSGHGDIRLASGVDVEYQDIRFITQGAQPLSLFLQEEGGSTLRFTNCVAGAPDGEAPEAADQVLARLRGPGDRLLADGLRVGLGFTHAIDARAPVDGVASSPLVDLRRCGFRDLDVAVRLVNLSHARLRECLFVECGTGVWSTSEPGAAPGGLLHVADSRFQDCVRGLIVQDRSAEAAAVGAAPADQRPFEPPQASGPIGPATQPTRRRTVRILRNEFRAPETRQFPSVDVLAPVDAWGVRDGEVIGARLEFNPHPASNAEPFGPQLLMQANVVHLLDHGVGLRVGRDGQVVLDHNTFVANAVRSVFLQRIASATKGAEFGLVVTRNIFQSVSQRAWLGLREGTPPPSVVAPRYVHGGVEIVPSMSGTLLRALIWVAANVFADFGTVHPRLYTPVSFGNGRVELDVWEGAQTSGPGGLTRWSNTRWDEPERCVVLRLPRVRRVQGDTLTTVEFDYHAALGAAGAPGAHAKAHVVNEPWLRSRGAPVTRPHRDYHGEDMDFHLTTPLVGAARERRHAAAWPLYSWGGQDEHLGTLVDARIGGRAYIHRRGSGPNGEPTLIDLVESFTSGRNWALSGIERAAQRGEGFLVSIPVWAWCGDPADLDGIEDHHDSRRALATVDGQVFCRQFVTVDGEEIELPSTNVSFCRFGQPPLVPECSFGGDHWDPSFVDYWIGRLRQYVAALTQFDVENSIEGWVVGDEVLQTPSSLELLAKARDAIAETDPLRRNVYTGLSSLDSRPHWGGLSGTIGGVALDHDESLSLEGRHWRPAPGVHGGATIFLGRQPRSYRGSQHPDFVRQQTARVCLVNENGSPAPDGEDSECRHDFGIILATPLDSRGRPRFATMHVQSSWHFNRSVQDPPNSESTTVDSIHQRNRSYAHHHGLVLRDTLELGRLVAERSLTPVPQNGHTFFNPLVVADTVTPEGGPTWVAAAPSGLRYYRHDFWAGIHHAGGAWCYSLGQLDMSTTANRNRFASEAAFEGLSLLKASDPNGSGLREALANGHRWQMMRAGDAPPPWFSEWNQSLENTANVEFGTDSGRTLGDPRFGEPGYYDLCTTTLRLGRRTYLIITNSRNQPRSLRFRPGGKHLNLTPASTANVVLDPSGHILVTLDDIEAVVLRIHHGTPTA